MRSSVSPAPARFTDLGIRIAGVCTVLAVFELTARTGLLPRAWFPPISEMYLELGKLAFGWPLWVEIGRTLSGWALGIGLAAVLAIPLGIALGTNNLAYRLSKAVIEFLRPVPSVALIPLAVLVYGTGLEMKTFLIAFATFWPILLQTIYGVQGVDPVAMDTARCYGLPQSARFTQIIAPSAAPFIATGLRIASAIALVLAITAELVVGAPGLGQAIIVAQSGANATRMYALIIVAGLLGWALNSCFQFVERRLLRWHPAQRGEEGR
ncbi:ABC-type nitrate/sulfonate/bicarbonate transport system permease component [Tamaricihabitans halophyticus]|uniref:ABC-type nitrate/sulfonate/bicarbonate transport system permease component n=1 Tax=Tamaricihabitans halophyticus TaxID=1262583 RepID=A0A4R2R3Q8_9PSEU|nr:ABC transporter permease [Tamaricihabitans halophyticus]TCP57203.1 ABC-type nitrate/sulfonate/bicarbonate transport system permease component [Tamaricihabitans halophyticus]